MTRDTGTETSENLVLKLLLPRRGLCLTTLILTGPPRLTFIYDTPSPSRQFAVLVQVVAERGGEMERGTKGISSLDPVPPHVT